MDQVILSYGFFLPFSFPFCFNIRWSKQHVKSHTLLKNAIGDSLEALEYLEGFPSPAQSGDVAVVRSCTSSSVPEGPELLCHGFNSTLISGGSLAAMPWLRYSPDPGPALPSQLSRGHGLHFIRTQALLCSLQAFQNPKGHSSESLGEHGWDGKCWHC